MSYKKWIISTIGLFVGGIATSLVLNRIVDPFFHYGTGLSLLQYPISDERYMNDGIQRHYEYEIMITGTSMSLNFNPSYVEGLTGKKVIKTAYSGATLYELGKSIDRAIRYNNNLETVICSLDPNIINKGTYEEGYKGCPEYLYDDNCFNDVYYLLNKDVITKSIAVINYTRAGNHTTTMDEYGRFDVYLSSGRDAVLSSYQRAEKTDYCPPFTNDDEERIRDNIETNLVQLVDKYPNVEFIFYIPPYSYCYWDGLVRTNQLDYVISSEICATSPLLEKQNVKLYGFDRNTSITTNLDNYTDTLHYTGEVCNLICSSIYEDVGRITIDNLQSYFDEVRRLYSDMEYDF